MPIRIAAAVYAVIALLIVGAWWGSVSGGPIFDDHFLVVNNRCFTSWNGILSTLNVISGDACSYRPLRYISYGIDHLLSGGTFAGYHVGNIVRHVFATAAAGWLATLLFASTPDGLRVTPRAFWAGVAVAVLWAMHPAQTDSVSYVSGRRDILAGGWTFAAVAATLVARQRGGLWWILPLWATLFGFLSKESAVVIPVWAGLWLLRGADARAFVRQHRGALAALVLGLALSFLFVLQRGVLDSYSQRGMFEWWGGTPVSNFATVAALQVIALRHAFLLHPLIGDYHADTVPLAMSFADPRALLGVVLVAVLVIGALLILRRAPLVGWGVLAWFIGLGPVSHVIPHHELFAEHYLYIPLFGWAVAMVGIAVAATDRAPDPVRARWVAWGAMVILVGAMGLRIVARHADWQNETAFYTEVLVQAPENHRAHSNLLHIWAEANDWPHMALHCAWLAPRWNPGTEPARQGLSRCADRALTAGDVNAGARYAAQLRDQFPDLGGGYRMVAMASLMQGNCPGAFEATATWAALTRDDRVVPVMTSLLEQCPDDGPVQWDQAVVAASTSLGARPETLLALATALGQAAPSGWWRWKVLQGAGLLEEGSELEQQARCWAVSGMGGVQQVLRLSGGSPCAD